VPSLQGDVAVVRLQTSYSTRTREVKTVHGADEIDAVAVYCSPLDRCHLLPIELVQGMRTIHLRFGELRNDQVQRYTGPPTTNSLGL
jgi:PD-(D/E)XK endonuclease